MARRKQKVGFWRRHLNLRNICGLLICLLILVGAIVVIVSIVEIVNNISLAKNERNEQLWKDDVNKLVRDAKNADDTWIMIPHLMSANQILLSNGYEPTLDDFIGRAVEIENSWDSVTYRKGLYFLKQDLSEWPTPDRSYNHLGEAIVWFGGVFAGFIIGWIGWKGIEMDDDC